MADAKVVLITGSSSGIGAAAARLFAERGYKVVVTGTNEERVESVKKECELLSPNGFKALGIVADLADMDKAEVIVKQTVKHFGRLDVLVNNAGMYAKTHSADRSSFDLYKKTMLVNTDSVVLTTMEAIPHLQNTNGNIVFVSSVASIKPGANGYAYRMSKASLSSYAKCLAIDVAPKVRVNIVSPGPISTPLFGKIGIKDEELRSKMGPATLLGRVGESEEIAKTIFYLASEEASYVNGAELFVDGGYICKPPTDFKT